MQTNTAEDQAGLFDEPAYLEIDETESPEKYGRSEEFVPRTVQEVEWVVGKIVEAREEAKRIKERADILVKRAERKEEFFLGRYACYLQDFLEAVPEVKAKKARSITLLTGMIGFRKVNQRIDILADKLQDAIQWAKTFAPDAVQIKEDVSKKLLAEVLNIAGETVCDQNGECVDFAIVKKEEDRFYVK